MLAKTATEIDYVYPRLALSFGAAFPNTCPPSLRDLLAGTIADGVFTPAGSVARHFFERERENRPDACQHLYFIQSVHGGPIKIGIAKDVAARLCTLQAAHPYHLKVLAVLPGVGKEAERRLHKRFAADRLCGEWFAESPALLEVIHAA